MLSPKSSEDQKRNKKKVFTAFWYYIRPEFWIYLSRQPVFHLIIQTLTLNGESAEISLGGTLKSRWGGGVLNLDGGNANYRWGDASPLQFLYWLKLYINLKKIVDKLSVALMIYHINFKLFILITG